MIINSRRRKLYGRINYGTLVVVSTGVVLLHWPLWLMFAIPVFVLPWVRRWVAPLEPRNPTHAPDRR